MVIPKNIWERLGLRVGDYVEVAVRGGAVISKPKKLIDADLVLTPEEDVLVWKGRDICSMAQVQRLNLGHGND